MFYNYLLIVWRTFTKSKTYSILNILGLTIGITCALIIFIYAEDELTYDNNQVNLKNIYRLNGTYHLPNNGGREDYAVCGPAIAEAIGKDFPEIKGIVRIRRLEDVMIQKTSSDERFYEQIFVADSNVFNILSFQFVSGNSALALTELNSIVISERMAQKYFNSTDVLGEIIRLPKDSLDLKITGVFANPPSNTQFKFDFITSMETFRVTYQANLTGWWNYSYYNYLLINTGVNIRELENKIRFISRQYIPDEEDNSGYRQEYSLTHVKDIHLHSAFRNELEANNKASYIYIFMIIGVFILVIACINFMNLATARSAMRAKEIGLRKVAGAMRQQLIGQFLGEAFIMTFCAIILSVVATFFLFMTINDFLEKDLSLFSTPSVWLALAGILLFVSLLSGSYPSVFLSAFKPSETIKGNFKSSAKGNILRKGLVVFQFAISTFLIAGTIIIYNHINYIQSVDLGFEKEHILYIPTRASHGDRADYISLQKELKKLSGVEDATLSSQVPGIEMGNNVVRLGWDDDAKWSDMRFIHVDYDFVKTYGLTLVEGRSFDESYTSDATSGFLINESGMRRLGWNNPKEAIGQKLKFQRRNGQVIGVLKDFHFMSSNIAIEPFITAYSTSAPGYISLKLSSGNPKETLEKVEEVYTSMLPDRIFEYQFLNEDFDKQYRSEDQFMKVFTAFALVAIIIACLGLYGLALFVAELKLKEIGIRKVLGATEKSLIVFFTKDFAILVLISAAIALPVSYWIMNKWLTTFPLRENINPLILLLSGGIALCIALITVSMQSIKAAKTNPVESIRGK